MCFKEDGVISLLNDEPPKFVDQFIFLGSNISSTKSDVSRFIDKVWTAIDKLSIIWKSDLSDKIKQEFLQVLLYSRDTTMRMHIHTET